MRTKLDHVRANVADLRRAVAWYQDTLGFEVESYWPPDDPNYAHFKAAGGATFAVRRRPVAALGSTSRSTTPTSCGSE